jgi:hypothetical protein
MRIPEFLLSVLLVVGFVLRMYHVPGGAILTVLAGASFFLYYSIGGYWIFAARDKFRVKQNSGVLSVFTGILFGLCFLPILLRLMLWPGASIAFLFLIPLTLIFFVIALVFLFTSEKKAYFRNLAIRFGLITFISLYFLMAPPGTFYKLIYRDDPKRVKLWEERDRDMESYEAYERYIDSVQQQNN